jgi:ergothioneine biosynthesis protein EgtB
MKPACNPARSSATRERAALLAERYRAIRQTTERLSAPLTPEDCAVQSMPDCSPAKWHLAHTSWFFETFVLESATYRPFHPQFRMLFNSYYQTVGAQYSRPQRALLTRPTLAEVLNYRHYVDEHLLQLLAAPSALAQHLFDLIEVGLQHEQQHQELLLTDIKHLFSFNPLHPAYQVAPPTATAPAPPLRWLSYEEGLRWIGHGDEGFCFDNEQPRHRVFLAAFELASRLVTNREYLEFMQDGGYERPQLWLSDGWQTVQEQGWRAPLYWQLTDGQWFAHTLNGWRELHLDEPVCHISAYEADAYARWAGARLPREAEWERAAAELPTKGNFVESGVLHPVSAPSVVSSAPGQMFGDVWEWTQSAYSAYPGYRPSAGALGEYNGKFMCNQLVLRGGSCVTPQAHIRASYRNFFPPAARWQFSGVRLARDV